MAKLKVIYRSKTHAVQFFSGVGADPIEIVGVGKVGQNISDVLGHSHVIDP